MLFERLQNLKQKFLDRTFRSKGYYVSTDGQNEETIRKNIRNQQDRDKAAENKKRPDQAPVSGSALISAQAA